MNEKGNAFGEGISKQHVKDIAQSLKIEGGFIGEGISSSHVNKVSKRVLRILSACALLETAKGMSLTPIAEALGQWLGVFPIVWIRIVFTVVCIFVSNCVWMTHRRMLVMKEEMVSQQPGQKRAGAMQETIFFALDNGMHSEEAICEWLRMRCSRRLAIADSSDRDTVMTYHERYTTKPAYR